MRMLKGGGRWTSGHAHRNWPAGWRIAIAGACLLLFCVSSAHGQVTTADVVGTVTDASGAVVPGATVTITNTGTNVSQSTTTSGSGDYIFNLLQVGSYSLKVEAKGFKRFTASNLTLSSGDRLRMDAQIEVGDVTQSVEVQGSVGPALQTDTSSLGTLVTSQAVQDVPLNGRNVIKLVQLAAGVTQGTPNDLMSGSRPDDRRQTAAFSANGQADSANNSMVDGMDNNDHTIGSIVLRPSIDAIQEVNVATNLYDASSTRTAGAVVDVITKSGSNNFHGSIYEFFRNAALNTNPNYAFPSSYTPSGALNLTTVLSKPAFRQNQYGASLGGPIKKNKSFFFVDFEQFRQARGLPITATVPTLCERGLAPCPDGLTPTDIGDFSDQTNISPYGGGSSCTPNEFVPITGPVAGHCYYAIVPSSKITPIGRAYFSMYPLPTNGGLTNNYSANPTATYNGTTFDIRVDHHFSDNDTIFGRYSYNDVKSITPGDFPAVTLTPAQDPLLAGPLTVYPTGTTTVNNFAGPAHVRAQGASASYVHVFSPTLLLNVKAGYNRFVNADTPFNTGTNAATKLGFACNAVNCNNYGPLVASGLPGISAGNLTGIGDSIFIPILIYQNNFQYSGTVTWNRGSQSIRIGASLIRRRLTHASSTNPSGNYNFSGGYTGYGVGDLLEGLSSGGGAAFGGAGGLRLLPIVPPGLRNWEPGVFVQDDWRAKRWLTLNLGLRYDLFTPMTEKYGRLTNWNPANGLLQGPGIPGAQQSGPTAGVSTDYKDISPRIGFAISAPRGIVIRGGFGISYYQVIANTFKNPPYTVSFVCTPQNFRGSNSVCPASMANSATVEYGPAPGGTSQVAPQGPNPNGIGTGGVLLAAGIPIPSANVNLVTQPTNCPVGAVASSAGCAAPTLPGTGNPYATFASSISAVWPHYPNPYLEQFNLQLQKDFKGNVIQIGYVGELGRHNGGRPNFAGIVNNQESIALQTAGVGGTPLGNPLAAQYPWLNSSAPNPLMAWGSSSYHALQTSLVRRFKDGLTVNVNYTWAHALSDGNGPCNPAYSPKALGYGTGANYIYPCFYDNVKNTASPFVENQWGHGPGQLGNTALDVADRIAGSVNYELPFGKSMTGIGGAVIKGWATNIAGSWQTGIPYGAANGLPFTGPNVVGGGLNQTCSGKYAKRSLEQWFDPACFSQPTVNTFGSADANQLYGPSQRNVDFSLSKTFSVTEKLKAQFRTEVFNLFNTPNFANPSGTIPTFASACTQAPASPGTCGVGLAQRVTTALHAGAITARNANSNEREIQFGLKLLF